MSFISALASLFSPDPPVTLNANWFVDKNDRQYIDQQIQAIQAHLSSMVLRGQHCTMVQLHSSSAACAAGDCLSAHSFAATELDPTTDIRFAERSVIGAGASWGAILGIAMTAASPGGWVRVALDGIVGPTITGLAIGSSGRVKLNTSTARCQRIGGAFASGDYPVGWVDLAGNLTLARGIIIP